LIFPEGVSMLFCGANFWWLEFFSRIDFLALTPSHALEFARQVNYPATRESALERIAKNWLDRDKSAARAWIASAPELSAEQKRVQLRLAEEL
jgi:hypothetical protein